MIETIEDVKDAHRKTGGHWFDKKTMAFFESKVMNTVHPDGSGGAYFVSSERHSSYTYSSKRRYSVRHCSWDGQITTVGEFMQYDSSAKAFAAIEELVSA